MNKTGLKAFVYSFSVSLLAIFAANKTYLYASQEEIAEIKLPQKNVVLFLKSDAINPSSYAAPTKKIALNTLPETIEANIEPVFEEPEIILAESFDNSDIPIEISQTLPKIFENTPKEENNKLFLAENDLKISENLDESPIKSADIILPDKVSIPLDVPIQASAITPRPAPKPQDQKVKIAAVLPEEKHLVENKPEPVPLLPIERNNNISNLEETEILIGNTDKINQVALANKNIPISGMKNSLVQTMPPEETNHKNWKNMSEQEDSPWVTAKARGLSKNQLINEAEAKEENLKITKAISPLQKNNEGVKIAAETIQNLLIPIPEKIMNQENLTPKLSFDSKTPDKHEETEIVTSETSPKESEKAKNKLLTSISSIFSNDKKSSDQTKDGLLSDTKEAFNKIKDKLSSNDVGKIMPTEMRLSFQPGRAEISGQTLRWIRAFATRAATDNSTAIEVRIDGTSTTKLQQKRLNLLHNILISNGVPQTKINTVFTQREPNSFIIRLMTTVSNRKDTKTKKTTRGYYQYW